MKWSEQAWSQTEGIYNSIIGMPFITELSNGSLPKPTFAFYMQQDALYLEQFARALALIGARANDMLTALAFMRYAENAIVVEQRLHQSYFTEFDITETGEAEPACHHYTHFLKSTAALDPVEVAMAAVLPCFWIYQKVGTHIAALPKLADNPYNNWIDTYGGEDFEAIVQEAIGYCDKAADQTTEAIREKMTTAFITASRLEYDFWDAAYDQRRWRLTTENS